MPENRGCGVSPRARFEILKRDGFACHYCGATPLDGIGQLVIDHVVPLSAGGETKVSNLVAACPPCNMGKGRVLLNDHSFFEREPLVQRLFDLLQREILTYTPGQRKEFRGALTLAARRVWLETLETAGTETSEVA